MENELAVLRAVRLKGRPMSADVAAATGVTEQDAEEALRALTEAGTCKEVNGRFMLDGPGRERLEQLLEEERAGLDHDQLHRLYEEFNELNTELKQIMHAWQLRDDEPNDHNDPEYDRGVIDRLVSLHDRFAPLAQQIVSMIPRLGSYPDRFAGATEKIQGGDHSWIAKPIADSFHTVWFELHEELIAALGLTREAEAASGRAE